MNYYVHQRGDHALGNFINLTPTLRWLAERDGQPVPVLFDTEYVRQCFLDCPFIRHIEKPEGERLFGSEMKCRENTMLDSHYVFERITGRPHSEMPHTYVDSVAPISIGDHVVLINGSGSERAAYVASKDVGPEPYMEAISIAKISVFAGSEADKNRNEWFRYCNSWTAGDIRLALSIIATAKAVIANDTGLAHAAAAMNKPLLVLWKNTFYPRCSNPCMNTVYAFNDHVSAVRNFLESIQEASSSDT